MSVPRRNPRKLVISDTDGTVLGKLVIPDGASTEDIIAAGERARADLLARKRAAAANAVPPPTATNGGATTAPSKPPREILCACCRQPFPEVAYGGRPSLAQHVETVERPKAEKQHRDAIR